MSDTKKEQRINIKFLVKLGEKPAEILRKLQAVYGEACLSKARVYDWANRFKNGQESVDDDAREGAPKTTRTDLNVEHLRVLVNSDRWIPLRMLSAELGINKETIRSMLHDDLGMRKLCAKMVPKVLTDDQKANRLAICEELLQRIEAEGRDWLGRIVTGDESWVFQYDPETKRQSSQWVGEGEPRPTKARMSKSQIKTMLISFFDIRGVIHHEFVPAGQTVNSAFYLEVLKRLKARVARVRPELAENGWMLHHDNAPSHSALVVRQFLTTKGIPVLPHPPYSPDLAPCDFFLFPKMKNQIKGTRFEGVEDIQRTATRVLKGITLEQFQGCFSSWERRWKRCVELGGTYCEGL